MSEPKSDEEIVKEFFKRFKSEGEKMLNVKAEEYENWLRTTLAAVREEEREKCLAELQRAAADAYLFASRTPTQDDTKLSN